MEMKMMTNQEIDSKFKEIVGNSQYIRVSSDHPLELYLGKNEQGLLTLRFNGNFQPVRVLGNKLLEVKQVQNTETLSILFSYNSKDNVSLFYNFCADLVTQTYGATKDSGYGTLINRFNAWKKLFYSGSLILNEQQVLGLIGELMFLKDYAFKVFGITYALNGWSGSESTHKDFSYKKEWFEIKALSNSKPFVTISSLEQLDSNVLGHLVVYSFEKMSPNFAGVKLNAMVKEVLGLIEYDSDKDIFISKLKQAGYEYNDLYDNYVYNYIGFTKYLVEDGFPRLRVEDMPKGIKGVKYDILLSNIENFKEN